MRTHAAAAVMMFLAATAGAQEAEKAEKPKIQEVMVVTASRTEQLVHDVPAAVSVLTAQDLEALPTHDYGDVLRTLPGVNVTQISARDIQVTSRGATNSLAANQLVLLDGRTLYLDFFGFVMWDFLPVDMTELKQIEVVRGPGSAVWGANAMAGVINLISKRPSELAGTSVMLGGGNRGAVFGSVMHGGVSDRLGYKVSASYLRQDAFGRPTGLVPGTTTPYPSFANEGTVQPKGDLRLDYDLSDASYVSLSGGYAGTDGLVHSGIGPFDIERGASMKYGKAEWTRGALRAGAFVNILDVNSTNLLAIGVNGRPIEFAFKTNTYSVDATNTTAVRQRHVLTYGVSARHNDFELSIAPLGRERDERGVFLQDEILFGNARIVAGARWDDMDPIGTVISPRAAFLYSPAPSQTVRVSFSRAFRSPSVINNYLDTAILNLITLPTGQYVFPTRAFGNPDLTEERMDAYEVGYVGTLAGGLTVSGSIYRNQRKNSTDFYPASFYSAAAPPPGWPLPVAFLDAPPLRNALPSSYSYRNVGEIVDKGIEIALNKRSTGGWSWFANYTYQANPEVKGISADEINVAPAHRANAGAAWDIARYFVHADVTYQDEAIWRDVLDARYWGPTESFVSVGAALGMRVTDNATVSLTGTNLFDERIQQHVFGDIISRRVTAKVQLRY